MKISRRSLFPTLGAAVAAAARSESAMAMTSRPAVELMKRDPSLSYDAALTEYETFFHGSLGDALVAS